MAQGESNQEEIEYWKTVGDNSFKEGNYLQALEAYQTVARVDPQNTDAWKGLATSFSLLDRPYEALDSLDKAIEIDPTDTESLEIKNLILKKLLEENEAHLNRVREKESEKSNQKLI